MSGDKIRVPRELLAAACYCIRKHAGTESQTYKQLSALALQPAETMFAGMLLSDAMFGTYHPGDDA